MRGKSNEGDEGMRKERNDGTRKKKTKLRKYKTKGWEDNNRWRAKREMVSEEEMYKSEEMQGR